MASVGRVTVTLPGDLIRDIDRREKNRSRFIAQAVRRELDRRRREELRRSLENPHAESHDVAELGFGDWSGGLPDEDAEALVDTSSGKVVAWVPGSGWVEDQG